MGTVTTFDVFAPCDLDRRAIHVAISRARADLRRSDAIFSLWKPDSPASRLRRGEIDEADGPPELAEVLSICRVARDLTRGWFDALAMPGGVDPTGLVKGWAAKRAAALLADSGIANVMINAGGDIATVGNPAPGQPWQIGIQHPARRDALAAVVAVEDAVATSGAYERGRHLYDPKVRRYSARFASSSVTGPDLALADALATAVAVAGHEGMSLIEEIDGYEALSIGCDESILTTTGLSWRPAPFDIQATPCDS
jgi:thiamine biosynthesis lipoprotein